jgi:predicted TIM-barrel fold metal-dependent hydrolase
LTTTPIVDSDSHVTEPPDLWTSRFPSRLADLAPRPEWDEEAGELRWRVGKRLLTGIGKYSMAGWKEYAPSHPKTLEEADPACWDPHKRLERLDEYGVHAQVLYPNLIAFSTQAFIELGPEAALASVQAYNDFLTDFASADPKRLIPLMMLPFWDVEASVAEMNRAADNGHKGILLAIHFQRMGRLPLWDESWAPLLAAAQERGLSINFHIGFSSFTEEDLKARIEVKGDEHTRISSVSMMSNAQAVADVVCTGLCHRYPDLNFVSVESGAGWMPYLMESLDWHWKNFGGLAERPDMELPSFYVKRQVYGSFWFERESVARVADLLADNIMFETDFPHPTSLSPGPASSAENPRKMAEEALSGLPDDVIRKIFYDNAARLYHLDPLP